VPDPGRPVRVALLHNIISPHVVPLFERLAQQPGISLRVYFLAESDRNRRWATAIDRSFDYEVLPHWAIRFGRTDLNTFFVNPTVVSVLQRDGFDVLISVGWDSLAALAGFALCKITRKPFVLWSGSTVNEPSWRRSLTLPVVKQVVRGSNSWIAYGSRAREYLVRLGAAADRVFLAYNTVDVDWYRARANELRPGRDVIRQELGLGDGPVVLYVGQLIARKGALDLLAAHELVLQRVPGAQVVFVGYGPLEGELRARVAERHVSGVHLAGHVPIPDLPRYYVAADIFVLPSHEEVWGLVLNEAAASALPLIATDRTGAAPDLIEPGRNGQIVAAGDPRRLASAVVEVLARRTEMGAASLQIIASRTYAQNVGAILNAIEAAIERPVRLFE
jgi:glycosyltransferase involved in cell wall biosynthesis